MLSLLNFVCYHVFATWYGQEKLLSHFLFPSNVVKLNANRMVVGTLRGFDQFMNLVVDNTVEVNGDNKTDIGMVVSFSISLSSPKTT